MFKNYWKNNPALIDSYLYILLTHCINVHYMMIPESAFTLLFKLLFADTGHAIACFACSSAAHGCGDPFETKTNLCHVLQGKGGSKW